ncbi:hypothetical protein EDB87DRAFT_681092 [Lactarius vividus]|nr:hypothetical protein EDB87DRAFT_681092 [Lactarius vividus]
MTRMHLLLLPRSQILLSSSLACPHLVFRDLSYLGFHEKVGQPIVSFSYQARIILSSFLNSCKPEVRDLENHSLTNTVKVYSTVLVSSRSSRKCVATIVVSCIPSLYFLPL